MSALDSFRTRVPVNEKKTGRDRPLRTKVIRTPASRSAHWKITECCSSMTSYDTTRLSECLSGCLCVSDVSKPCYRSFGHLVDDIIVDWLYTQPLRVHRFQFKLN